MKRLFSLLSLIAVLLITTNCSKSNSDTAYQDISTYPGISAAFGTKINLSSLANYANQPKPNYITKDNSASNPITDKGATLGRVLFYDKNLSSNNTVSCATCHQQANAFSDNAVASTGIFGTTGRHSMRLINTRFSNESKFFWDERAASLELQTTQPIRNHIEMGYSGTTGDQDFAGLITKLNGILYYKELFKFVYGTEDITESKMQSALGQFIRSIQSFDSKFDVGRSTAPNDNAPFSNYTASENNGKNLFLAAPVFDAASNRTSGGLGCAGCHGAPEFAIDPNSRNNGIIGTIGSNTIDIVNTRAPSLRDLTKANGIVNGPMMHTGVFTTLQTIIGHYGTINIAPGNTNLDPRLRPNGIGQKLNLTATEVNDVMAFIKTLGGTDVYVNAKWASPF